MGRVKNTVVVVLVIVISLTLASIGYICVRIFWRRRSKYEARQQDEESDEIDPDLRTLQMAVVEKTPLALERCENFDEDADSLILCKRVADSQKYDQSTLWKKYEKLRTEEEPRSCSIDNGWIKVEFYHQSYNQTFKMKIIQARGLKCNVPKRKLNTRVQILLITPLKTRNIPRKTRIINNSNDPEFQQVLEIKLTRKTTRDSSVEVSIWSIDNFYKETLIGGYAIDLKKFDVAQRNIIEQEIQTEFEEHENPGFILVSLGYKEEEERLTVIVMRGKMLKCSAKEDTILRETINPYVKVNLYCDRKQIKKQKTEVKIDQINPVFNHLMEFLVPKRQLDSTNLIFNVMDRDIRTDSKRNIGRIVVGANSTGRCWNHWQSALVANDRVIPHWHQLWH